MCKHSDNMQLISFCRGESPIGDWTIRVWDQGNPENTGSFLGWNMIFWGAAADPSKATLYELPVEDFTFPPQSDVDIPMPSPTATKNYPKPSVPPETPAEAEVSQTASPTTAAPSATSSAASATSTPTMDEGWFSGMSNLVSNPKWFFGAIAAVGVFAIGVGIFFFRRRRASMSRVRTSEYASLPGGDDVQMSAVGSGGARPRTKELYDAFGELSDDEDADEETHLRGGHSVSEGIGFHSGFLDDDEPPHSAGASGSAQRYRDDPDVSPSGSARPPSSPDEELSHSSGDGSWQHAEREA